MNSQGTGEKNNDESTKTRNKRNKMQKRVQTQ